MTWTPMKFGKYQGKTLPEIIFADPDWFFGPMKNVPSKAEAGSLLPASAILSSGLSTSLIQKSCMRSPVLSSPIPQGILSPSGCLPQGAEHFLPSPIQ
jgi:uncharacterized protein (DUF3820 family)